MCGRYTLTTNDRSSLGNLFEVDLGHDVDSMLGRYNVAPGQEVLAVRHLEGGAREAVGMRWGLVPGWADDLKVGYRMINARSERMFESRAYGSLVKVKTGRCLIPADGFFEWMEPGEKGGRKRPVRFSVDGGRPFALAGLTTHRAWEDGELISCTVITTEADEAVAPVHDRMPVILCDPEDQGAWIEGDLSREEVEALCQPFDPERVSSRLASPWLNRVGEVPEGPELLDPDWAGPSGS